MKPARDFSLPSDTFLPPSTYDPLRHATQDFFWYHIEPYFHPVCSDQLAVLQPTNAPTPTLQLPTEQHSSSSRSTHHTLQPATLTSVAAFPLCHRLTAALLDDGKGQPVASKPLRSAVSAESTWLGPSPQMLDHYNCAMEQRIRHQLLHLGLLDNQQNDTLLSHLRLEHWRLQNLNSANAALQTRALTKVTPFLKSQASFRKQKITDNFTEIKYLETMGEKCGKRAKGRFNKLLNQMHPNRHLKPGDPINQPNKTTHNSAVTDKPISKKRKRKAPTVDKPPHKQQHVEKNASSSADSSDILAPHIASIIWKHNNHASIDDIVSDLVETVPNLTIDVKEARRRITKCLSFSRKPYRFRKTPNGLTYSAAKL
ncbi:unnamed protein product [Agarophyton chilense]